MLNPVVIDLLNSAPSCSQLAADDRSVFIAVDGDVDLTFLVDKITPGDFGVLSSQICFIYQLIPLASS